MTLTDPKIYLTFQGNDLPAGHNTSQTVGASYIVNRSIGGKYQKMSGLKSSSDQISLQLSRKAPCIEDLLVTEGNVKAVLADGDTTLFTGFVSTNYKWGISQYGQEVLNITLESVGTRLLQTPFIESGKHFFKCTAYQALYAIVHPLGISIRSGDNSKLSMNVAHEVDAGTTRRELVDQLLYECNCVYFFDASGKLCVDAINPSTTGASVIDKNSLYVKDGKAVQVNKTLRSYKGARVKYTVLAEAENYLVYRNTTGQSEDYPYCNLPLGPGEYFDGAEIFTAAEWAEETADEFREPTLISAVNAASESAIVGSGKIVNISNIAPDTRQGSDITVDFTAAGGPYFSILAHNAAGGSTQYITRMDLYADIVYEKSNGIIRTQIDGTQEGKSLLEEELSWIHDKTNASKHANLLAQFYRYASASYQFFSSDDITLGSVIRLKENLYSGLDVYVLVTAKELDSNGDIIKYTGVGVSTFDLTEDAYHGETANSSGSSKGQRGNTISTGTALWGETTCRGYEGIAGDLYINTETDNLYKCTASGSATTAMWQYIGNIRGKTGSMEGVTNVIQYAVSTSDTEFIFPDGVYGYRNGETESAFGYADDAYGFEDHSWSGTVDDWYKGLYVWQRVATTVLVGYDNLDNPVYETTYSEPVYCKDITEGLEASCIFRLVPESENYLINKASPGETNYLVNLIFTGYPPAYEAEPITAVSVKDQTDTVITDIEVEYSGAEIRLTIPHKLDAEQINITVTGRFNESATCAMTALDQTKYDVFGGLFASDADAEDYFEEYYGGVMEGYTYAINDSTSPAHLALRTYTEDGWALLSESGLDLSRVSQICGRAQKAVLTEVQAGSVTASDYGYFNIIVANVVTAAFIGSKQIQLQEDEDHNPGLLYGYASEGQGSVDFTAPIGQRASGRAFILDSNGIGELSEAYARNLNVREALRLWKDDTETVGADIEHPALTTISETMGADPTGVTVNTTASRWLSDAFATFINNLGVSADAVTGATGTFGSKTVSRLVKATNLAATIQAAQTGSVQCSTNSTGITGASTTTLTVPSYITSPISVTFSGSASKFSSTRYYGSDSYYRGFVRITLNGTVVYSKTATSGSAAYNDSSFSYTTTITGGDSIYLELGTVYYSSRPSGYTVKDVFPGQCSWNLSKVTIGDFVSATGLWLGYSDNTVGQIASGVSMADRLNISAITGYSGSFDSNNYLTLRDCGAFINYWTFTDSGGISRTLQAGRTYGITSTSLQVNGSSVTGVSLTRLTSAVVLYYKSGNTTYSITLASGEYYNVLGKIAIAATNTIGVKMMGNYPKRDADDPDGGFDCGNSAYVWDNGYFKTLHYTNLGGASARILKENISPFTKNALELLRETEIVNFNYKKDKNKKQKIGFIADDTPAELAGEEHDKMEIDHCVAVLIKAVQELAAELDKLKETT